LLPNEFLKQHRGASRQRGRPTSFFGLLSSAPAATTTSVIRAEYVLSFRRGRKAASVFEAFAIISPLPERFQIQLNRRNFLPAIRVTIELDAGNVYARPRATFVSKEQLTRRPLQL
jgi:hypothetical protein